MRAGGLRFRILALVGVVVVASITAVGSVVRGVAHAEFDSYVHRVEAEVVREGGSASDAAAARFEDSADRLEQHVREHGLDDVGGVVPVLGERTAERHGVAPNEPAAPGGAAGAGPGGAAGPGLLLVDASGVVVASNRGGFERARAVRLDDGALRVEAPFDEPDGGRGLRTLVIAGPRRDLAGPGGEPIATLHLLPPEDDEPIREDVAGPPPEQAFRGAVDARSLVIVVVTGVLALLVASVLASRAIAPLERLIEAARRMEAGDLGHRVDLDRSDEIGDLGRAFDAMAASLERTETLRRNLVSDVAHELRTPLTRLRAQAEALQDGLRAPDEAALAALHEETLLLGRLVDDLQELALAEAGRLRLAPETFALASVLVPLATAAGAPSVAVDVPDGLVVHADPQRVRQVVGNLVDNARGHVGPDGRVRIHAARSAGDGVEIAVSDDGPGIAPEHLPHVFDRFYRADPSRQRASGGAGLGLAIVKHLVEAMGGRVTARSEPGEGATFTVTLPAGSCDGSASA